jgi:6-bladed beta-propeller
MTSCDKPGRDAEVWEGVRYDSAGVEVFRYGNLRSLGEQQRIDVQSILEVGGGADFFHPSDVTVDEDGRIYVLDSGAHSVNIFDDDGSPVGAFGGEGDGPSEFRSVSQLLLVGEQIVLPDIGGGRLVRYSRDGEALGTTPIPRDRGFPLGWGAGADGDLVVQHRSIMSLPVMESFGGSGEGDELARLDPIEGSLAPILALPRSELVAEVGERPIIRLFAPEPAWDVSPAGRLVFGLNSEVRFTVADATGVPLFVVEAAIPPAAVSDVEKRAAVDLLRTLMINAGAVEERLADLSNMVQVADTYPAFTELMFGPSGTIMLQRSARLSGDQDHQELGNSGIDLKKGVGSDTWDVFAGDGVYIGFATFPRRFAPKASLGPVLYGIHADDYGVQSVRAYQLALSD